MPLLFGKIESSAHNTPKFLIFIPIVWEGISLLIVQKVIDTMSRTRIVGIDFFQLPAGNIIDFIKLAHQ